ncbi:MAG: adenylate/guanylate cyclase domain-containing protein [Desulfobacter sp.]|nr:MAG: adenylate/guanylate cyclase domain-containing protein [Desulfobacter sp.]
MTAEQKVTRKLRAILSADVKGYSLLMTRDEASTVQTLKEYRGIMSETIKGHSGRVVDAPGDNLLAEFPSAVEAVQCSVEIQNDLKIKNAELPENKRLEFRIGVNIGDVIQEGKSLYGEGINIAARIEGLARPGGICISRNVYDQVKNKLGVTFEYVGRKSVKNISDPVYLYKILLNPEDSEFIYGKKKKFDLPQKPSIAVIPFENLSGDSNFDHVCDAITEEITTGLTNVPLLFVIARSSTSIYRGQKIETQKIGRELGVQYVLEGSIQKSGERIRVTAQLVDALNQRHLWADRYEGTITDLFDFQDKITIQILTALQVRLEKGHKSNIWAGATKNLTALQRYLQAHEAFFKCADIITARRLFKEAKDLDSGFSLPYVYLGWLHLFDAWLGLSESPEKSIQKAMELAQEAVRLYKTVAPDYSLLGKIYYTMGDVAKGIATTRHAIEISPNDADCHVHLGGLLAFTGHPEEALFWINKAVRLNPQGSWIYNVYFGMAYNILGRYKEAIKAYKTALKQNPDNILGLAGLVEGYCLFGKHEKAQNVALEVYRVFPSFSAVYHANAMGYRYKEDTNKFLEALQKAGLK